MEPRNALLALVLPLLLLVAVPPPGGADEGRPWGRILASSVDERGTWPEPRAGGVVWREDLGAALEEAAREGRPLLVTARCLPCKQCSAFDAEVLEGGRELDPLLARFVTVRLTNARDLDLRLLRSAGFQDLDLSWWGWFLAPDGRLYGIFGGKDHVSDATRISVPALAATLRRVLDHHAHPAREAWDVDGPVPDLAAPAFGPEDLPGWDSWARGGAPEAQPDACLHCHQVAEVLRQPALDAGTFDKRRDLEVWPLPENVGLVLDRDHGLRVRSVERGSPAARAGLRAGDELAAAEDRRLFGQADFRGVLHRGPRGAGRIEVWWTRAGEPMSGTLEVREGWRWTEIGWRKSIASGNVGPHPGFWPLPAPQADRRRLGVRSGSMAVKPLLGKERDRPSWRAGLREDWIVVAVDGKSPDVAGREFLTWFRLNHDPGAEVAFTALDRRGRKKTFRWTVERLADY